MPGVVEILLVEDNPADVMLFGEALEASGWRHHLNVVEDGVEALDFLNRREGFAAAPRPDLVLMDLNTPRKNGREVLAEIRADPTLADIPVIIVSGSAWERPMLKDLGIPEERYIVKPIDFPGIQRVVEQIREIWRGLTERSDARNSHGTVI